MGSAHATLEYSFTLAPTNGSSPADYATGTLYAQDSGLGDGSLHVTSGSMTITSTSNGSAIGTYVLEPLGPLQTNSATGQFYSGDLIFPGNDAANGLQNGTGFYSSISNPSYLDNGGLVWVPGGGSPGSAAEANFWGNGNSDYAFYTADGMGNYPITDGGGLTFTLTPIVNPTPEPGSFAVWGLGLAAAFFVSCRRRSA